MASTDSPHTIRWGIMACGWIAGKFCKDLLCDPAVRDVHDVRHEIVAAASSTSRDKAAGFLKEIEAPGTPKAYGSYAELVADSDVDIIYVASPHSHHFQNAMLCLQGGKHVLCEKALTVNAAQARKLVEAARERNLFFMEAVWTRFFPISIKVRELVASGAIGTVYRTIADLSFNKSKPDSDDLTLNNSERLLNLDLAGGAMLDLGIYSLTWIFMTLYHVQKEPEGQKERPAVVAAMNKHADTGADEQTTAVLQFPQHKSMGVLMTGLRVGTDPDQHNTAGPAIRIQGALGEIQVMGPAFRPLQYRIIKNDSAGKVDVVDCPVPKDPHKQWGEGFFWEADECARCLRDGKLESATLPWSESVLIMEVMEEGLRQGGVTYPELIVTDVYDANSPLNTGVKAS